MKVGIICLDSINNIGEEILYDTTNFLISSPGIETYKVSLYPNFEKAKHKILFLIRSFCALCIHTAGEKLLKGDLRYKVINYAFKIKLKKYYQEELKNADAIIYALGMLKFKKQNFSYLFSLINSEATRNNIPVFMDAMSIAKADKTDWRYQQLVKAINLPCTRIITTRDGIDGLNRLNTDYITNHEISTNFVGDPALWIPECYNISPRRKESDVIGINVIREQTYVDYGINFTHVKDMYISLINELNKHGYKWKLFTNGIKSDIDLAKQIVAHFNLPSTILLPPPGSVEEYLSAITQFQVVFGARLHACITAVALDIPVVGLLWDDKLRYFAKTMKIPTFFCETNELEGKTILKKIQEAMNLKYDKQNINSYKFRTKLEIDNFIDKCT